jgi:hypothetical protein
VRGLLLFYFYFYTHKLFRSVRCMFTLPAHQSSFPGCRFITVGEISVSNRGPLKVVCKFRASDRKPPEITQLKQFNGIKSQFTYCPGLMESDVVFVRFHVRSTTPEHRQYRNARRVHNVYTVLYNCAHSAGIQRIHTHIYIYIYIRGAPIYRGKYSIVIAVRVCAARATDLFNFLRYPRRIMGV